jgi:hypothetical protein
VAGGGDRLQFSASGLRRKAASFPLAFGHTTTKALRDLVSEGFCCFQRCPRGDRTTRRATHPSDSVSPADQPGPSREPQWRIKMNVDGDDLRLRWKDPADEAAGRSNRNGRQQYHRQSFDNLPSLANHQSCLSARAICGKVTLARRSRAGLWDFDRIKTAFHPFPSHVEPVQTAVHAGQSFLGVRHPNP